MKSDPILNRNENCALKMLVTNGRKRASTIDVLKCEHGLSPEPLKEMFAKLLTMTSKVRP